MTDSPNSVYRRVGATAFPVEDTGGTEGAFTDAAQETLLALFASAIRDELGQQFERAASGTPLRGASVVADTWPGLLTPQVMKQRKAVFPLLALGWTGQSEWSERTLSITQCRRKWALDYVLGPLEVGAAQRLEKIFHKIEVLLQMVVGDRGHKSYRNGEIQWGDDLGQHISMVWIEQAEAGQARFSSDAGETTYYALSCQLTTLEVEKDIATYPDLTGATFTAGVGGDPDGVIAAEIVAQTEYSVQES